MKVSVKSVQVIAMESGIPESVVDRYIDALCMMTLRVRKSERRVCLNKIKAWYFNSSKNKPQLFDILNDD
jgi:hypothetical protein